MGIFMKEGDEQDDVTDEGRQREIETGSEMESGGMNNSGSGKKGQEVKT